MLEVNQLNFSINNQCLLKDIHFKLLPGEILSVLGPNGAGKSTLLKCLSGDYLKFEGSVLLNGNQVAEIPVVELAKQRAVMPQSIQLDFPFLVKEVVQMAMQTLGHHEKQQATLKALERFEVAHLIERNYLSLSGGEQQRVQLSRVLAQLEFAHTDNTAARFLFLDECTSSLDLAHQHQVFKVIRAFAKQNNIGVLAILHDLNLASQYSDHLLMLQQGEIKAYGLVSKVFKANVISKVYNFPVQIIQHPRGWPLVISV